MLLPYKQALTSAGTSSTRINDLVRHALDARPMTKARLAIELYCGRCGQLYIDVTKCPHHGTAAHDLDLEEATRVRARYAFAVAFDPNHDEEESSYRDEWYYCSDMWCW